MKSAKNSNSAVWGAKSFDQITSHKNLPFLPAAYSNGFSREKLVESFAWLKKYRQESMTLRAQIRPFNQQKSQLFLGIFCSPLIEFANSLFDPTILNQIRLEYSHPQGKMNQRSARSDLFSLRGTARSWCFRVEHYMCGAWESEWQNAKKDFTISMLKVFFFSITFIEDYL